MTKKRLIGVADCRGPRLDARVGYQSAVVDQFRCIAGRVLFCLVTFEAALFGSGRMLQVGPWTAKMVLYFIVLLYTIWSLLCLTRIRLSTALLLASFGAMLCGGLVNGIGHDANLKFLGEDLSPLLSFLVLPFYEMTIDSRHAIYRAINMIEMAAAIMAAGYGVLIGSILSGAVSFKALYIWLTTVGGDDFIFEGTGGKVFYKGALFIAIALIFLLFKKQRAAKIGSLFLFLSLFVVGVRGFFLALTLCGVIYVLIGPIKTIKRLIFLAGSVLAALIVLPHIFALSGDKGASNSDRIVTTFQVSSRVTIPSFFVGHGFGIGVPIRPEHMENVYLEIFHKQGIVGLLWWGALVVTLIARFAKAVKAGNQDLAYPLFLSAMFICAESATNPFLNNPIGMYPFLICFASLGVLAEPGGPREAPGSSTPRGPTQAT